MTFTCDNGHDWNVAITLGVARRLGNEKVIDLVTDMRGLESLMQDMSSSVKMLDVLWAIVKPEAQERGLSQDDFEAGLGTEKVKEAIRCVQESIENFIHGLDRNMHEVLTKGRTRLHELTRMETEAAIDLMNSQEAMESFEKVLTDRKDAAKKNFG